MSGDMNRVFEIGRIVRDAELKYTASEKAVASFTLAVNEKRRDKGNQYVDTAHFFDVRFWGSYAQSLHQYLTKGKQVCVEGKLRQDRWEHAGQKHSKIVIDADNIQLLGNSQKSEGTTAAMPHERSEKPENPCQFDFSQDIPF
jgi:single-strand DNA-binding protein